MNEVWLYRMALDAAAFLRRVAKELHEFADLLALHVYARQQAENPTVLAAIEDAEERIRSGRGFPDALPLEEFVAQALAEAERLRRAAAGG